MVAIAIIGDCTTTTSLALAAAWPRVSTRDLIVAELDPTGGSLAAWLDAPISPSMTSVVTALHASADATTAARWTTVDSMVRRTEAGVRFIPAPFRAREARSAVAEAERSLLPLLEQLDHTVALLDLGRVEPGRIPRASTHADLTLLVHRIDPSSAPAAMVRLERMGEIVEALTDSGHRVAVILIGDQPFGLDEVLAFAAPNARGWMLEVDQLAAAVFAGRSGVSARRLARLPLMRTAATAASALDEMVGSRHVATAAAGVTR